LSLMMVKTTSANLLPISSLIQLHSSVCD
jgi:hypothetical protein